MTRIKCPKCGNVQAVTESSAAKTVCGECGIELRRRRGPDKRASPVSPPRHDSVSAEVSETDWDDLAKLEQQAESLPAAPVAQPDTEQVVNVSPSSARWIETCSSLWDSEIVRWVTILAAVSVFGVLVYATTVGLIEKSKSSMPEQALREARRVAQELSKLTPLMKRADVEKALNVSITMPFEDLVMRVYGGGWSVSYPPPFEFRSLFPRMVNVVRRRDGSVEAKLLPTDKNRKVFVVPSIVVLEPIVPRPGEAAGDFAAREERFKNKMNSGGGFLVMVNFDDQEQLTEVAAFVFPKAMADMTQESWWNESYLGTHILKEAGVP